MYNNTNSIVSIHRMYQSTSSCLLKRCKKRYKISQFKEATNNTINISNTSHLAKSKNTHKRRNGSQN